MKRIALICAALVLTGCAAQPARQIIDMRGVNHARFQVDQAECQGYAEQVSVADSAAGGAVLGSIFGALLGAAIGGSDGAKLGAQVGLLNGAAGGAGGAANDKAQVARECMRGRGYKVLL